VSKEDEGGPYKANDGESGESLVETSGQATSADWIDEIEPVFGSIELVEVPERRVKPAKVTYKRFEQSFPDWLNENLEKYDKVFLPSRDTLIPQESKDEKLVVEEKPSWESLQKAFRAIEDDYFHCLNCWSDKESCKRAEKRYFQVLEELENYKRFYGLVVLHANDDKRELQHGWSVLYQPVEELKLFKRYKTIQAMKLPAASSRVSEDKTSVLRENALPCSKQAVRQLWCQIW
jgi:hypothetical protein